jgi:hypothetical protein
MVPCKHCQQLFKPKREWQHFCSEKCRNLFHAALRKAALSAYTRPKTEGTKYNSRKKASAYHGKIRSIQRRILDIAELEEKE